MNSYNNLIEQIAKYIKYKDDSSLNKFLASWRGHANWADTNNLFNHLETYYDNYQY